MAHKGVAVMNNHLLMYEIVGAANRERELAIHRHYMLANSRVIDNGGWMAGARGLIKRMRALAGTGLGECPAPRSANGQQAAI